MILMKQKTKHEYDGLVCDVCNERVTCVTNLRERAMYVCGKCINYINLIE